MISRRPPALGLPELKHAFRYKLYHYICCLYVLTQIYYFCPFLSSYSRLGSSTWRASGSTSSGDLESSQLLCRMIASTSFCSVFENQLQHAMNRPTIVVLFQLRPFAIHLNKMTNYTTWIESRKLTSIQICFTAALS